MSPRSLATLVALVGLALAGGAVAEAKGTIGNSSPAFGAAAPEHYESPQRFMFELKFTPYSPKIDQSAGLGAGQTPFADLFNPQFDEKGKPTKGKQPGYRLLTSVEFDVQFLRRAFGNFGIGLTTGFYRRTTHGFELAPQTTTSAQGVTTTSFVPCTVPNCTRSGDQTSLNVLPLSALLVYRFDLLANKYHIPLVPYFKVGLAYYIWWIENGSGFGSVAQKPESAYGGTFGFVLNPGIALQLDFIERGVARTLDGELGINHTYLFCELNYANVNGFGASNKLNLSDTMLNAGIAFEF